MFIAHHAKANGFGEPLLDSKSVLGTAQDPYSLVQLYQKNRILDQFFILVKAQIPIACEAIRKTKTKLMLVVISK